MPILGNPNPKQREDKMETQFFITYEVVDPVTQAVEFVTEDRFIAETHYERGYTVVEQHTTLTRLSRFTETRTHAILHWHDEDENVNPEIEEA
jgi:hypothetical protein